MSPSGSDTDFHRLGQALVELTRRPELRSEDPSRLLEQIPAAQLVEMACHHRVPGVVYRSLADLNIEDEGYAGLRIAYQMASLAHGRCLLEVAALTDILAELEEPWLVVKGPVLAEVGYGDPGARLYEDLDLVVGVLRPGPGPHPDRGGGRPRGGSQLADDARAAAGGDPGHPPERDAGGSALAPAGDPEHA